jgi:molybdenum cofactor guanylyltransferase
VLRFAGAVLSGGSSRRMGRDKALVPWRGAPLAAVAVTALRRAGATSVHCVGGDRPALEAHGLTVLADRHPGEGPLGGILTALVEADAPVLVVLTCDLPDVSAADVRAVLAALEASPESAVAAPLLDGRPQFLSAAYRVADTVGVLQAAFDAGERAVRRACAPLPVTSIEPPAPDRLRDADTPQQLARRRGLASPK